MNENRNGNQRVGTGILSPAFPIPQVRFARAEDLEQESLRKPSFVLEYHSMESPIWVPSLFLQYPEH
jgi:hypothetical protein